MIPTCLRIVKIVKMKLLVALVSSAALAYAKVSYDGYKAFHIDIEGDYDEVESSLINLDYVPLSCQDSHSSLEFAISPDNLEAFDALQLNATVIIEDLGEDIKAEGGIEPWECMCRPLQY